MPTGAGVTVGIVDTDFDVNNPELAGRLRKEVYSPPAGSRAAGFFGAQGTGDPHGTEVAEVLGGRHSGIAPEVRMLGIASGWGKHLQLNAEINDRLYDQGVRIFNQSNGVGSIDTSTNGAVYYDRYAPFVAKGGLFVWSTGNLGRLQPSMTAGLPRNYPELQTGWLAVTAVNAVGGSQGFSAGDTVPGAISSYANRCGVAANWCLAAAGDFVSPSSGKREFGTSFAVPLVSGTLALVQQVYPWMRADLLRQTILSSARPMGESEIYGWGILHPARAIQGPALFSQILARGPDVHVSFDHMTSTFANAIGGDAGLVKDGSGTLILPAANTYRGGSRIVNGSLHITGSVASGIQIDRGGTLAGAGGLIGGSVLNHGQVRQAGQGLTIAGDYTATSDAVLSSDMHTPLKIGGSAVLGNSHLVLTTANVYVPAPGQRLPRPVLNAAGVNGSFNSVGFKRAGAPWPPLLAARVAYAADAVHLHLSRIAMTTAARAFGTDATRIASAANLEQAMRAADAVALARPGHGNALLNSAAALQRVDSLAALGLALDSLSGQIHASAPVLSFQQAQALNRRLSQRMALAARRSQSAPPSWWGSRSATRGKLARSGYAGANTSATGRQFGVDTRLASGALIGAAVSYTESRASFDRFGGNLKGRQIGLSLYTRRAWPLAEETDKGAYVAARIGAGRVWTAINRVAIAGSDIANLHSTRRDNLLAAYVESGIEAYGKAQAGGRSRGGITVMPFAAIACVHLKRGGFQEQGGSFGLRSDSRLYRQWSTLLGVRTAFDLHWFGGRSRMLADAAWQHALNDGKLDVQATFTAAPASNFTVQGIALPRNSGWSSIAIATAINRRWSWFARYDRQFSSGWGTHMASLGVRIALD